MAKVLISNNKSKQVQSILEYRHNFKYVSNRAYAINAVDKAISKGQHTIVLDPSKLKQKKYISTEVFLYDRQGEPLTIETDHIYGKNNNRFDLLPNGKKTYIIQGQSWPQHGDKFNKADGRKYALVDAVSQLNITSDDSNYKDLIDLKLFLQHFELRAKDKYPHWKWPNNLILSWQYIDLWNALLTAKSFTGSRVFDIKETVEEAAINLVGQANYDNLFSQFVPELLAFFCNGEEFGKKDEAKTIEGAYYFYSSAIAQYYDELKDNSKSTVSQLFEELEDEIELQTDELIEDLQDTLQG